MVNGSFWIGAAIGAIGALVVLDPAVMPAEYGWRFAFIIGGVLGFIVLLLRRFLPESPRWLMTHGQPEEAERVVAEIERRVERETGRPLPPVPGPKLLLRTDVREWFGPATRALFTNYRDRAVLGIALMAAQAFCYNAVFFTYALILTRFYGIASGSIGWFMLPFAAGNFLGPLLLGRLFDTLGRRLMITATYAISGILMAITGWLFVLGVLDAVQQTAAWTAIFFVASAAASSAYLTVGESFPLEMRAIAIALFYAFGTGVGGVAGPALFGALIDTGSRMSILWGYLLGGGLMLGAAVVAAFLAVPAERRALEDIAPPLSSVLLVDRGFGLIEPSPPDGKVFKLRPGGRNDLLCKVRICRFDSTRHGHTSDHGRKQRQRTPTSLLGRDFLRQRTLDQLGELGEALAERIADCRILTPDVGETGRQQTAATHIL